LFGNAGRSSLFGQPVGQTSVFASGNTFFGKKVNPIADQEEEDAEGDVPEENEAPIYAETDKVEFKTGVTIVKSPYTKIFEVR